MSSSLETLSLSWGDPLAQAALTTGWIGPDRVIARAVLEKSNEVQPLVFFERVPSASARPASFGLWFQTVRGYSLTATLTPGIAIFAWVSAAPWHFALVHFLLAVLGVAGLQIAINLFNDVEDYRRLIDLPNTAGGSGAIQGRWFTPMELRKAAWTSLLLGSAAGTAVVFSHPQILAPIAGIAGLGTLLYSGRSWGLKYRALGDVAVFLLCGPLLTLGFSGALANGVGASALWLGGFFGWLACSLLHVNNLQDIEVDRARGLSTLAILLGFERSKVWLALIQFFAMACLIAGWATGVLPVGVLGVAVVQAALSLRWLKRIWPASGPESALLARVRIDAAQIHLSSGLVLVVVLALSRLVQF